MAEIVAEPVATKHHVDGSFIKPVPVEAEPTPPSKIRTLRRLLGYMAASKIKLTVALVMVLVGTVLNILGPYLFGVGIDQFVEQGTLEGLDTIVLLMILAAAGSAISIAIQGWLLADIAQQAMYALRRDLFTFCFTFVLCFALLFFAVFFHIA